MVIDDLRALPQSPWWSRRDRRSRPRAVVGDRGAVAGRLVAANARVPAIHLDRPSRSARPDGAPPAARRDDRARGQGARRSDLDGRWIPQHPADGRCGRGAVRGSAGGGPARCHACRGRDCCARPIRRAHQGRGFYSRVGKRRAEAVVWSSYARWRPWLDASVFPGPRAGRELPSHRPPLSTYISAERVRPAGSSSASHGVRISRLTTTPCGLVPSKSPRSRMALHDF